jgi:hypothetical protein
MSQRWVRAGGEQYQQQAPRQNHAHQATRDRAAYLAQARQRSKQQRDYFDDDDDDEDELLRETAVENDDDEVDPLDAFMAGMAAEEPQRKKPRPARLDEAARDAVDDDQYATNRREQLKKAPAANEADAADGEGVSYVDGRAVVDRSQKKRIAKLAPADHRRSYDDVESCFIPGGLEAWNASHGDGSVAGSATAPSGGSVKPAPSFAAMFGAAPKASWLLKGAARAGLERPTAVQALTVPAALCGCDVLAVAETGSGALSAWESLVDGVAWTCRSLAREHGVSRHAIDAHASTSAQARPWPSAGPCWPTSPRRRRRAVPNPWPWSWSRRGQ